MLNMLCNSIQEGGLILIMAVLLGSHPRLVKIYKHTKQKAGSTIDMQVLID